MARKAKSTHCIYSVAKAASLWTTTMPPRRWCQGEDENEAVTVLLECMYSLREVRLLSKSLQKCAPSRSDLQGWGRTPLSSWSRYRKELGRLSQGIAMTTNVSCFLCALNHVRTSPHLICMPILCGSYYNYLLFTDEGDVKAGMGKIGPHVGEVQG